jgi:hypothetical protein
MAIISLNNVNQLIVVMVKCGVLFEVRTDFLNVKKTSFGFKGLMENNELLTHDNSNSVQGSTTGFKLFCAHCV